MVSRPLLTASLKTFETSAATLFTSTTSRVSGVSIPHSMVVVMRASVEVCSSSRRLLVASALRSDSWKTAARPSTDLTRPAPRSSMAVAAFRIPELSATNCFTLASTASSVSPITAEAEPDSAASAELFSPCCSNCLALASRSATVEAMALVAVAVWLASAFTSLATTAKPRPASPARAASMVAFRASILVWRAMPSMPVAARATSPNAFCSEEMSDWPSATISARAWTLPMAPLTRVTEASMSWPACCATARHSCALEAMREFSPCSSFILVRTSPSRRSWSRMRTDNSSTLQETCARRCAVLVASWAKRRRSASMSLALAS